MNEAPGGGLFPPLGRLTWGPSDGELPEPGAVGVWLARPEAWLAEAVAPWLSEAERARRDRFLHEGARGQFVCGRWLLRQVAGRLVGREPAAVELREGERGALMLPAESGWYVNLSHTDGLVAVAAARTPVGVDVEDAERRGRTVELADRFFAPAEAKALRALPEAEQRERFFALWTLKESYIKARGLGLAIPLASFAFDLDRPALGFPPAGRGIPVASLRVAPLGFAIDTTMDVNRGEDAARWRFARAAPTERHRLAVALSVGVARGRGRGPSDDGPAASS